MFNDAKLTKGMGSWPISYDIYSPNEGKSWRHTIDLASDDAQNTVFFCAGGKSPDVVCGHGPPSLQVQITLSPEAFARLLSINWKREVYFSVREPEIPWRDSQELPPFDPKSGRESVELPIDSYNIDWEERPLSAAYFLPANNGRPVKSGILFSHFVCRST